MPRAVLLNRAKPFLSRAALLLLAVATTLPACAGNRSSPPVDPATPAFVEVQNQSFYDMTVYVVRSGARTRLGVVNGNSTAMFEIPRGFVNPGLPIRFMADPIGGSRTPFSEEIPVNPGDTIVMTIPPN